MHLYIVTTQERLIRRSKQDWGLPQSSDIWAFLLHELGSYILVSRPRPVMAPRAAPQLLPPPQPLHLPRSASSKMTALPEAGGLEPVPASAALSPPSESEQQKHPVSLSRGSRRCWNSFPPAQTKRQAGRGKSKHFRSR